MYQERAAGCEPPVAASLPSDRTWPGIFDSIVIVAGILIIVGAVCGPLFTQFVPQGLRAPLRMLSNGGVAGPSLT
jgi:hypothetical protein